MINNLGRVCAMFLGGTLLGACSSGIDGEDAAGTQRESIIRATANGGRNEVVLLHIITGSGGTAFCSGTYYAPRVVLTAAHCLDNVSGNQVFVYHGDNFAQDIGQLTPGPFGLQPPAPGQPSFWAQADSFEQHPQWDPVLNHPDLAVVYLDRKLPFDPLPIARFRLDNTWLNRQVTISGWGHNATPTPVTGTGGRVQRTGRTVVLGTPTAADFHPEDPNPGMLNAAVRQNQFKTDGRAPNSNACFGDSGGPVIVNKLGQDYIGGVFYFTGLSCEDYNLHTRLDPFLPFLDEGYRKGGQAPLIPRLDCVAPNANGTLTAYFGYKNDNGVRIDVPFGTKNVLALDTPGFRPTRFLPGEHHFAFGVDFTPSQTVTYKLSPTNSPTTTLTATTNSPRCGVPADECGGFCRALARSGCGLQSFEGCMLGCTGLANEIAEFVPTCAAANTAWNECTANTAPGAANWECIPDADFALALACNPELDALNLCLSGG